MDAGLFSCCVILSVTIFIVLASCELSIPCLDALAIAKISFERASCPLCLIVLDNSFRFISPVNKSSTASSDNLCLIWVKVGFCISFIARFAYRFAAASACLVSDFTTGNSSTGSGMCLGSCILGWNRASFISLLMFVSMILLAACLSGMRGCIAARFIS